MKSDDSRCWLCQVFVVCGESWLFPSHPYQMKSSGTFLLLPNIDSACPSRSPRRLGPPVPGLRVPGRPKRLAGSCRFGGADQLLQSLQQV